MRPVKIAAPVLALLLLTSCGPAQPAESSGDSAAREQAAWSSGYEAGYEEGYAKGLTDSPDLGAVSSPADEPTLEVPPEPAAPELDSSGFVELSEAVPDAILEIRYYSTYNFVGERIDGYEEPVALLTREAASALREVSDDLAEQGFRLKIYDAYRPQSAVDHFKRWAADPEEVSMKACFYPELDKSVLFSQGYISSKSGHSRGSTVDLTLLDMSAGKELDMGGTFDYFGNRSHPGYPGLTEEQAANRKLLRNAMRSHGFQGINTEWWHFTLREEPYPNTYFNFPVTALEPSGSGAQ